MKKKKVFIVCGALFTAIVLSACFYVGIGSNNVENKMWNYLKENNYDESDIKSVDVKHSFMNILLSYNEWAVDVVFEDDPDSVYKYTLKDGRIGESGVSGASNKEDLNHLSETNDFGFSYKIVEGSFVRGGRVGFSVALTNQQSESYVWTGSESNYRANVKLSCMKDGTESFICFPELIPDTDDVAEHEVGAGETQSFDYYFTVPDNVAAGEYSLVCSFGNSTETFNNVFTLE